MNQEIAEKIESDFGPEDKEQLVNLLNSLTLENVMADSESKLEKTRLSVLKLSKGNVAELMHYMTCAKKDFHEVIRWAAEL